MAAMTMCCHSETHATRFLETRLEKKNVCTNRWIKSIKCVAFDTHIHLSCVHMILPVWFRLIFVNRTICLNCAAQRARGCSIYFACHIFVVMVVVVLVVMMCCEIGFVSTANRILIFRQNHPNYNTFQGETHATHGFLSFSLSLNIGNILGKSYGMMILGTFWCQWLLQYWRIYRLYAATFTQNRKPKSGDSCSRAHTVQILTHHHRNHLNIIVLFAVFFFFFQ